ncbi:hypothetical protein [Bailinhaonella thermotolerans]|uniref:Uncharacterized protein n=1 Tax=Bailinhaonella thermotolerans TaxID=1070861 RepID=A0A3A4A779_9ACTN|nr:hypothetical protein [Bailinhaonella thermotolerans]RJL24816.1 hypothetical protein D5H75_28985 [Bailinhaonella thermotolerans]
MRRPVPLALGLGGLLLCAVAVALYLARCDAFGLFPYLAAAYVAGAVLIAAGLVAGLRPGVVLSLLAVAGVAVLAAAVAYIAFLVSFSNCFEF